MDTAPTADHRDPSYADDVWTEQRIRALGAVIDIPTAAAILGLGRALAYQLARDEAFPVPVIRAGTRYRVPTAPLLAILHLSSDDDLTSSAGRSVDHHQPPVRPTIALHSRASTPGEP